MCRCGWDRALLASVAAGLGAIPASAGDDPTSHQENLAAVAFTIRHDDCRFVLVGDSISSRNAAPRMGGAIMRTWHPDQWVGRACTVRGDGIETDGTSLDTDKDGGNAIILAPPMNQGGVTPHVYSAGHVRITPNPVADIFFAADYDENKSLLSPELTHDFGIDYGGSPWAEHALHCRILYWRDAGAWSAAATRGLRSGETPTDFEDGVFDPDGGPAGIACHDQWIPPGPGDDPRIELRSDGAFDETGAYLYVLELLFYRVDDEGERVPGFQLVPLAGDGFQTQHWYKDETYGPPPPPSYNHLFTDQVLRDYLAAIHHPNVFAFLIGQNMNVQETNQTLTAFKQRYELMVERFINATLANGQPEPLILMISPPKAGWLEDPGDGSSWAGHPRFPQAAQAIHELAVAHGWGFVNLYALTENAWPTMSHPNNVHPLADEEADAYMAPVWDQIMLAPCVTADLDDSGGVDVIDLLGLIASWGPCPNCPGDQEGDDLIGITDLLALMSEWGPCE